MPAAARAIAIESAPSGPNFVYDWKSGSVVLDDGNGNVAVKRKHDKSHPRLGKNARTDRTRNAPAAARGAIHGAAWADSKFIAGWHVGCLDDGSVNFGTGVLESWSPGLGQKPHDKKT